MNGRIWLPALGVAAGSAAVVLVLFWCATGAVRTFVGDIVVVVLLVSSLAALRIGSTTGRLVGVGLFAFGVEAWQGLGRLSADAHPLLHLTVGSTADPLDLLPYALGLGSRLWRSARTAGRGGVPRRRARRRVAEARSARAPLRSQSPPATRCHLLVHQARPHDAQRDRGSSSTRTTTLV
ncbi:DUF2809 domain-containing protein [Cellulomonas sp. zg-ZUI222]|nr:DUF2809 domain-containing protein [Cellulomonas wangleii]